MVYRMIICYGIKKSMISSAGLTQNVVVVIDDPTAFGHLLATSAPWSYPVPKCCVLWKKLSE